MKLGRYIRAVTGHNNLLYHLSNIDSQISPICRFCLGHREEFHHLATDCPPLWQDRHDISAQEANTPETWTQHQIIDFTFIPKIDQAFVRPLYQITSRRNDQIIEDRNTQDIDNPDTDRHNSDAESEMDISVWDAASESPSSFSTSTSDDGMSIISVCSDEI